MTSTRRRNLGRLGLGGICVLIGAMWVYAFVFAPRESINRVNDREWSRRTESICAAASVERAGLADFTKLDVHDTAQLVRRADLIDRATDIISAALDRIEQSPPADEKGSKIVPLWLADYRTYLEDRRDYADSLRLGTAVTFAETQVDGIPISEKIGTFARANEMGSCVPPYDLSA